MVRVKGSYVVKPAEETPKGPMSLSDLDQIVLPLQHTIYFYQNPACDFPSAIDVLKDSLSKVLVPFYPLAGRLRSIGGGRFEIDCNSMGAQLLVAESEAKIDDFGDFTPTPQIRALLPPLDYSTTPFHELPLLLVQLTKLSCGGISLGVLISHLVVDGPSAMHFMNEWTKIARGDHSINLPFLDRTVLQVLEEPSPPPSFEHSEFSPQPLLIGHSDSMEERKKETTITSLKLNKDQIEKLKEEANKGGTSSPPYTRFEAVAGHVWRCASKARGLVSQQPTALYFTVDSRNRMEPPLPRFYFGNAVARAAAQTTSGELVSKPLSYAAYKIREAINQKSTDEYWRSSLRFLRSQEDVSQYRVSHFLGCTQGTFQGNPNIGITSWKSLPIYGADFGWGKEIHMGLGAINFDGKAYILPSRDEDGSFIIPFRLQVAHMEAFKNFFYQEI